MLKLTGDALPKDFADLEPLVADWVLEDASARMAKRLSSTMDDIKAFYHAMLPRGEAALAYLSEFQLGAVPVEAERLLKLMLMLAEAAPAVEWYNDPRVYDGFSIDRTRFLRKISDTAAQV
ncbi:MAG: hypothetical protein JWQ16_2621 [Novosphingobium sp.]|nr:hypothetical protein [Novosphingobium sp.]